MASDSVPQVPDIDAEILVVHPYTDVVTVPVATTMDARLSLRALGLLVHLLGRHARDGRVRTAEVCKSVVEGRDAVRKALAELQECDYVCAQRVKRVNHGGRGTYWETTTHVFAVPQMSQMPDLDLDDEMSEITTSVPVSPASGSNSVDGVDTTSDFQALVLTSRDSRKPGCSTGTSPSSQKRSPTEIPSTDALRPGWPRARKPSARARARAEQQDQDDLDASKHSGLEDPAPAPAPPAKSERAVRAVRTGAGGPGDRPTKSDAGLCAQYFDHQARTHTAVPRPTNFSALTSHFATWLRQGTETATIRAMVDAYFDAGFARKDGSAPWVDFLGARAALTSRVSYGGRGAGMEAHRYDEAYWTEPGAAGPMEAHRYDETYWTQAS